MKYTELPPGEQWHNPENAESPPKGWRFLLEGEVRSELFEKTNVLCRMWTVEGEWSDDDTPASAYESFYSYIIPDTTPFGIPSSANRKPDDSSPVVGIPLRAYFAGLAMQGYVSLFTPENVALHQKMCPQRPLNQYFATCAVQMADALIAALEGKEGE